MQSLGIYVQNNLIKYAKVSKEKNNVKIEAYGVRFYDTDLEKTIEQIINETRSFQIPVSVNIDNEKYAYSTIFGLLDEKTQEKAMDTEFELYCENNKKNKNTIEYRKLKTDDLEDRDKIRIIYPYVEKTSLVEKVQMFDKYKLQNISPVPLILNNLNQPGERENCYIVNIEEKTTITTIINGKTYNVAKLDTGMNKILNLITERESSVQKAYEICKNTTVYTRAGQNLKVDGNEYLDEIITLLLEIIEQVKQSISQTPIEITNIYLSGMGLIINNIDLLFQENFIDKKCEILIPYFVEKTNIKINIKDYIEVNSAISLAIQGTENKNRSLNFSEKGQRWENLKDLLTSDVGKGKGPRKPKQKTTAKQTLNADVDFVDNLLLRIVTTVFLVIILYIAITIVLTRQFDEKLVEAQETIDTTNTEIAKVNEIETMINTRTEEYKRLVSKIDEANSKVSETYLSKNAIPNLLNKIMYNIPTGVKLLLISNSSGKKIEIIAQAKKYDQLGYFKAALEEEGILTNITTTKGEKQGELINITITGELPY